MQKYFASLRPLERRLVVAVALAVFVVLNWWFIWPEFSDYANYKSRLDAATLKLNRYKSAIDRKPNLERQLAQYESKGEFVDQADMGVNFSSLIQQQSADSGVVVENASRQTVNTNDAFFVQAAQNIAVLAPEEQLVNFLYELGNNASMIRVSDLTLQPDPPHQRLSANIKLVASYQKSPTSAAKNKTAKAK